MKKLIVFLLLFTSTATWSCSQAKSFARPLDRSQRDEEGNLKPGFFTGKEGCFRLDKALNQGR